MATIRSISAISLVIAAVGCTRDLPERGARAPAPIGPHGGFCVALPESRGYGEVTIEVTAKGAFNEGSFQVVVYFLELDLKTPMSSPLTSVRVKLLLPHQDAAILALGAEPKTDDPSGLTRFASVPGPYLVDEPVGELSATIGTNRFTAAFMTVR